MPEAEIRRVDENRASAGKRRLEFGTLRLDAVRSISLASTV
jgi:hypothetical protein